MAELADAQDLKNGLRTGNLCDQRKGVGHESDYRGSQNVSLPLTVRDRTVDLLVFLAAVLPGMWGREWRSKSVATGAVQHDVRFRA